MQIPGQAGVMILGGACLFPQALLPVFIFEPRYRTLLAESLESHRMLCIALQKPGTLRETPLPIAGIGLIRASVQNPNGTSNLIVQGLVRVRLGRVVRHQPYRVHAIAPLVAEPRESLALDALRARVLDLVDLRLRQDSAHSPEVLRHFAARMDRSPATVEECVRSLRHMPDPGHMADLVAVLLLRDPQARQVILQTVALEERFRQLVRFLRSEGIDPTP